MGAGGPVAPGGGPREQRDRRSGPAARDRMELRREAWTGKKGATPRSPPLAATNGVDPVGSASTLAREDESRRPGGRVALGPVSRLSGRLLVPGARAAGEKGAHEVRREALQQARRLGRISDARAPVAVRRPGRGTEGAEARATLERALRDAVGDQPPGPREEWRRERPSRAQSAVAEVAPSGPHVDADEDHHDGGDGQDETARGHSRARPRRRAPCECGRPGRASRRRAARGAECAVRARSRWTQRPSLSAEPAAASRPRASPWPDVDPGDDGPWGREAEDRHGGESRVPAPHPRASIFRLRDARRLACHQAACNCERNRRPR